MIENEVIESGVQGDETQHGMETASGQTAIGAEGDQMHGTGRCPTNAAD